MSGINSGAENKKSLQPRAAWKILSRKRNPSMGILINAVPITKDGRVPLSCHQVSIMFDRFSDFLLTTLFYSSPDVLSLTLHQAYLSRPKLLWVLQLWLDSFLCWAYLIQLWPKKRFCQPDANLTSCFRYLAKDCSCFKKSRHRSAYALNQS